MVILGGDSSFYERGTPVASTELYHSTGYRQSYRMIFLADAGESAFGGAAAGRAEQERAPQRSRQPGTPPGHSTFHTPSMRISNVLGQFH